MPYSRRRSRLAPGSRVQVRLTPVQRDLLIHAPGTPKDLGHLLHRAPVRDGKLAVQVNHRALEALIAAAARVRVPDQEAERALNALLRYLESLDDRFADPESPSGNP